MTTFSDTRDASATSHLGLGRVRTRCKGGAVSAAAGYVATFIVDAVRHTPSDDSVVFGLEIGFVGVAVLCSLIAAMVWIIACHVDHSLSLMVLSARAREQIEDRVRLAEPGRRGDHKGPIPR